MDFEIATEDLHSCRFSEREPPRPEDGQALLAVEAFGLSANNITYAVFGRTMSYWDFFPAEPGWGRMPVWGFATVAESRCELAEGTRLYGYLPPSSELLVRPAHVGAHGFSDGSPHRAELPGAYNAYAAVEADAMYDAAHEDAQMLLRPLFFTSWLLDDFLGEAHAFGAGAVVLSSASSKTASGLAYLLAQREGIEVVGLTSRRSAPFVRELGVYDHVVTYDELEELPAGRAVYVDMAGDAELRAGVHGRYGAELAHSAVVGATHHDRMGAVPEELPGPRPTFFFAPERIARRSGEWGRQELERRLAEAWHPYVDWARGWLRVHHGRGPDALRDAYLQLLDGTADPAGGHVLTLAE